MPKFQLISDCHINFGDLILPGGQYLIMAGDIMEAGHLRIADNAHKDVFLADRYRRFIKEELCKYEKVIYVCGNHEHYSNAYEDTFVRLKAELPENILFLEGESCQIEDVHIFGATLWTDCNRNDPMTHQVISDYMNDFRGDIKREHSVFIKTAYGHGYWTNGFTTQFAANIFKETVKKLDTFCELHKDDKVLVVTHHAPTELSISDEYRSMFHQNGGYHSRLGDFIIDRPCIKTWCHGHVHHFNHYEIGDNCSVISNPRGYYGHEEIANDFTPYEFTV